MTNKPWVSGGTDTPDPDARQYTVETSDGHTLGVAEYGPEDGFPIFGIHGTPGSRYGGPPPEKPDLYGPLNVRPIGFYRAGDGVSTRRPDRGGGDAAGGGAASAPHPGL